MCHFTLYLTPFQVVVAVAGRHEQQRGRQQPPQDEQRPRIRLRHQLGQVTYRSRLEYQSEVSDMFKAENDQIMKYHFRI